MDFCREFGCLWFMFILGLLFCCPLATLAYFTYQTIFGHVTFCSLWIDVPGRLTLFLLCYYLASMCGFLPLARKYRINCFLEPFVVWRLESWTCLFRNLWLSVLIPILRKWQQPVRNTLEAPVLQENNREIIHRRIRSEPIDITSLRSYVASQNAPKPEIAPKSESPEAVTRSGSISSLGSSFKGIVVPITKGRSSKPHYLSEPEIFHQKSESSVYRNTETKETDGEASNTLVPVTGYASTSTEEERSENLALYEIPVHTDAALASYEKHVGTTEHLEKESNMNEMSKNFLLNEKLTMFHLHFSQAAIRRRKPLPQYGINLLPQYRNIVPEYRNIVPEYRNIVPEYRNLFPEYRNIVPEYRNIVPQYRNLFPQYRNLFPEIRNPPPTYRTPPPSYRNPPSAYTEPLPTFYEAETMKEDPNIIAASVLNDDGFACAGNSRLQDGKYFDVTDDQKPEVIRPEEQLNSVHERLQICCTDEGLKETAEKEFLKTNEQAVMHDENQQPTQTIANGKEKSPPKLDKAEPQLSFSRTGARNKQLPTVNSEQESEAQHRVSEAPLNFSRIRWRALRYRIRQPPWASETSRRNVEIEMIDENQRPLNQNPEDKVKYSEKPWLINSNNGVLTIMRLPRSQENFKLLEISSFPSKTRAVIAKGKIEQTKVTDIMTRPDDGCQTSGRIETEGTEDFKLVIGKTRQRTVSEPSRSTRFANEIEGTVDFKLAEGKIRQRTMSEPSSSTKFKNEIEEKIDFKPKIKNTRQRTKSEPLSSTRFENETEATVDFKLAKGKIRQRTMSKSSNSIKFETKEKTHIKFEMSNTRQRTMSEPSSSTRFENETERVDLLKQIPGETRTNKSTTEI